MKNDLAGSCVDTHRGVGNGKPKRKQIMSVQSYQIIVKGLPLEAWAARFEETEILPLGQDQCLLRGVFSDQPALHGLLDRIRAVGLELVSVKIIPSSRSDSLDRE